MHVATEDPSLAKAGFVTLANEKAATLGMFSTKLARGILHAEELIPSRWRAAHSCHLGANVYPRLASALRALMNHFQRNLVLHGGTDDEVVEELTSKYSFNRECIPENLGE